MRRSSLHTAVYLRGKCASLCLRHWSRRASIQRPTRSLPQRRGPEEHHLLHGGSHCWGVQSCRVYSPGTRVPQWYKGFFHTSALLRWRRPQTRMWRESHGGPGISIRNELTTFSSKSAESSALGHAVHSPPGLRLPHPAWADTVQPLGEGGGFTARCWWDDSGPGFSWS